MKAMRFREFKKVVGQKWIEKKTNKFPDQGWSTVSKDNVIYVWFKPEVHIMDLARIESTSGKQVNICVVPRAIMKHTSI